MYIIHNISNHPNSIDVEGKSLSHKPITELEEL